MIGVTFPPMDTKIKELIAVGASVTANCVPCLKYHFSQAQEAGATDDEIQQAVAVGQMVRKGAAGKWDEEVNALLGGAQGSKSSGSETSCEDS